MSCNRNELLDTTSLSHPNSNPLSSPRSPLAPSTSLQLPHHLHLMRSADSCRYLTRPSIPFPLQQPERSFEKTGQMLLLHLKTFHSPYFSWDKDGILTAACTALLDTAPAHPPLPFSTLSCFLAFSPVIMSWNEFPLSLGPLPMLLPLPQLILTQSTLRCFSLNATSPGKLC